jgi:hypothetical protein
MHFFAGSGLKFQNPVGSGRFSSSLKFFGQVPNPPRIYPLIYNTLKKKTLELHVTPAASITPAVSLTGLTHCPPATVEQSLISLSHLSAGVAPFSATVEQSLNHTNRSKLFSLICGGSTSRATRQVHSTPPSSTKPLICYFYYQYPSSILNLKFKFMTFG